VESVEDGLEGRGEKRKGQWRSYVCFVSFSLSLMIDYSMMLIYRF